MKQSQKNKSYHELIAHLYHFPYRREEQFNKIQTLNVTFQVTDACNLCCSYCYQINKGTHVMPLEVAQKFIDLLLENNEYTQQYVDTSASQAIILDFIGGEPLLQINLIDQIVEYFLKRVIEENHPWQYQWRISMSSNGTLYFNPDVQKFLDKYKGHVSYGVSIDGNKELHDSCRVFPDGSGSYDKAIAAVHDYVNNRGGYMGSKMTLAPNNIQYLNDAIKNLIAEGYDDINLNCIFEKGWTVEHAKILYQQLKNLADYLLDNDLEDKITLSIFNEFLFHPKLITDKQNWCGGNGAMLAVDWKGDIFPCVRYMESSLGPNIPPVIAGNVNDGIMTNPECKNCIQKLKTVNRINQSTEECINCPIAEGCAWCQAYNYQDSGTFFHRATYICITHKARALANCYYYNMKYWKHNENIRMKLWLPDEEALKIISNDELQLLKALQYPIE